MKAPKLSQLAETLIGSEIVKLGAEIKERIRQGARVYNFTVGDFDPAIFPIPVELEQHIEQAYRDKHTNYPMAEGNLELRQALHAFIQHYQGLDYDISEILVASGGRPLIYTVFRTLCDPGDKIVYAVPSWNNNHYTHFVGAEHIVLEAKAENNFMPTAAELKPHLAGATLLALCSIDPANRPKSVTAFRGEVERALTIGAEFLVVHPGSAKDQTPDSAIDAFSHALAEACHGLASSHLTILLENTAGQGNVLGSRLAELSAMRDLAAPHVRLPIGYCLDTCHSYAAGYDIATAPGLDAFLAEADTTLGLENVPVIHANDSKGALGSKLDRHANIGEGYIGREGFRRILNHPKLHSQAFILETPIDNEGDDRKNVDALWSLSTSHARKNL